MTARLDRKSLRLAADIVQAAYEDAMRRHGMFAGTISVVSSYARENLAALDDMPEPDADNCDLERLREAVTAIAPRLDIRLRQGPEGQAVLHVNNPDIGGRFCEDVTVAEVPQYLWSWGEAVGPTTNPYLAAARIVHVVVPGTP